MGKVVLGFDVPDAVVVGIFCTVEDVWADDDAVVQVVDGCPDDPNVEVDDAKDDAEWIEGIREAVEFVKEFERGFKSPFFPPLVEIGIEAILGCMNWIECIGFIEFMGCIGCIGCIEFSPCMAWVPVMLERFEMDIEGIGFTPVIPFIADIGFTPEIEPRTPTELPGGAFVKEDTLELNGLSVVDAERINWLETLL